MRRSDQLRLAVGLTLVLLAACARSGRPRLPEAEDYVFPRSPPGELRPDESRRMESAWRQVLAGRSAEAEKEFQKLLGLHPGSAAPHAGVGYARLRSGRLVAAAAAFDAALARRADYLPALLGGASVAMRLGNAETGLALYRRAVLADPADATARRRLDEVKRQLAERGVTAARAALAAGHRAEAIAAYRSALDVAPEVGDLRVELADTLVQAQELPDAALVLEAAPAYHRNVCFRLGQVLTELKEPARALEAYRRILTQDPGDSAVGRLALDLREELDLLRLPEEYRRIRTAPRITRADLAALFSVKIPALSRLQAGEPEVAVDISGSWAREHILRLLAFDLMDVYPNHTFQPGATVRRGDLAHTLGRILDLLKWPAGDPPIIKDISPNNLFHDSVARTVSAGFMDLTPEGNFEPWRQVSGPDAVLVIDALARRVAP